MNVYLTFDVEVWCNDWTQLDARFPASFDRYVYGRSARGSCRKCRTCSDGVVVCGGAMPYARSFSLAPSVIQSVVQAGARRVTTSARKPAAAIALRTSSPIWSIAGQPL